MLGLESSTEQEDDTNHNGNKRTNDFMKDPQLQDIMHVLSWITAEDRSNIVKKAVEPRQQPCIRTSCVRRYAQAFALSLTMIRR